MTAILKVDSLQNEAGTITIPVSQMQHRIIQRVTYNHRAGYWTPENTYYWCPGAFIDFQPRRSDSRIRWSGSIPFRQYAYNAHGISHWIFYLDDIEIGRHSTSGHHYEQAACQEWDVPSWGAGDSKRMGYRIRSYSSGSHNIHTYYTEYWNGTGSGNNISGRVSIEEYVPSVKLNTASQPHSQVGCQLSGTRNNGSGGAGSAQSDGMGDAYVNGLSFGWHSTTGVSTFPAYCAVYLGNDYPSGAVVNQLRFFVHANHFGDFEFQGSNNSGGSGTFYNSGSWTTLYTGNGGGYGSGYYDRQAIDFTFNNTTPYLAYRIKINNTSLPGGGGSATQGWASYGWELNGY